MKYLLAVATVCLLIVSGCSSSKKGMKVHYQVLEYKGHKMLKGVINRGLLVNDTAFAWFQENSKYGEADADAVNTFKMKKDKFTLVVFGGTWCEDTQNLLPKLYKLIDASGYPENQISLVAVDKQKQTLNDLQLKFGIANVPTFIVMQGKKEMGRVVEYGKIGDITKELGQIVAGIQ